MGRLRCCSVGRRPFLSMKLGFQQLHLLRRRIGWVGGTRVDQGADRIAQFGRLDAQRIGKVVDLELDVVPALRRSTGSTCRAH